MTMLDLDSATLQDLCMALEDHSPEHEWWLDPRTGELELRSEYFTDGPEEDHPEDRGLLYVEPVESSESYGDMAEFVERVGDRRARDLL
jgi:hypothetical protein